MMKRLLVQWLAPNTDSKGFTLMELLVVVIVIGVLAAIASPGWLGFMERQSLNKARGEVHRALQAAKSNAIRDKRTWQMSLREKNNRVQWAIHLADEGYFIPPGVENNDAYWQDLEKGVRIDKEKNDRGEYETSIKFKDSSSKTWRVLFNPYGCPVYKVQNECGSTSLWALGRIALQPNRGGKRKGCVIISTILGAMRVSENQSKPKDGKYCY